MPKTSLYAKVSVVVATKDRPDDLRTMLRSMADQSHRPDQVVIVDSSAKPVRSVAEEFGGLNVKYIHVDRPSASGQRNTGIRAVDEGMDLIAFLDDDATLESGALEAMLDFWRAAPVDMGGAAFNWLNHTGPSAAWLKRSRLVRWSGLYSDRPGLVMPSGWQTITANVPETLEVEWLLSGASVWRRKVLEKYQFDEFFDGYSYLEDLDFSYSVGREYRLAVVANAGFRHDPSPSARASSYHFGKVEARNRLYFVRKHGLSVGRCYLGLLVRLLMTTGSALLRLSRGGLARAGGNLAAIARDLVALGGKSRPQPAATTHRRR